MTSTSVWRWSSISGITNRTSAPTRKSSACSPKGAAGPGPIKSGKDPFVGTPKSGGGSGNETAEWDALLKEAQSGYNNPRLPQGSFQHW